MKKQQYTLKVVQVLMLGLFLCYIIWFIIYLFESSTYRLWDFRVYYSAALCYLSGTNPYDIKDLWEEHTNVAQLPYMYPPLTIYYFLPFAAFSATHAIWIYLCIKLGALAALFRVWVKIFFKKAYIVHFCFFALLAFNATLHKDLFTGNISVFEQLFIWIAIYYFLKAKYWHFALLIVFVSTFKLLPIVFLGFLFFVPGRQKWRILTVAGITFFGLIGLNLLFEPELTRAYIDSFSNNLIRGGGISNASSLEFFKSLFKFLGWAEVSWLGLLFYAVFVCVILAISAFRLLPISKLSNPRARLHLVFALCLVVILVLPRFADYSYVLAIMPVFYLIVTYKQYMGVALLVAIACLLANNVTVPFFRFVIELIFGYYTWIIVLISWYVYMRESEVIPVSDIKKNPPAIEAEGSLL